MGTAGDMMGTCTLSIAYEETQESERGTSDRKRDRMRLHVCGGEEESLRAMDRAMAEGKEGELFCSCTLGTYT